VCCPVLVLAGEQDPVTPVDDAREIAAAIPPPWARLVVLPDAGHGTWRDQPEAALAVLRGFIGG
jgi:proline iminopeptidase